MDGLKPVIKIKFQELKDACAKEDIVIGFVSGFRSISAQDALYAQGRTTPGDIVTKAKGGQSMHNYGVAFDVCPIGTNGQFNWGANDTAWQSIGKIGQSIGLEWGGSWASFIDKPHFQMIFDYSLSDFENNKIDWTKWDMPAPIIPPIKVMLEVPKNFGILQFIIDLIRKLFKREG